MVGTKDLLRVDSRAVESVEYLVGMMVEMKVACLDA
jgi:hypothetical protein